MNERIPSTGAVRGSVCLVVILYKKGRKRESEAQLVKQAQTREAKLMEHNERMVIQLEGNTTTLQRIERSPNGVRSMVENTELVPKMITFL
ncbi:BhlA/UviB family holin-like peptide [Brevibacillus laterosporus]|uniref:BhlA/UviB family holin-like peptide n=1 Tax=Brevibacillus laterosporus TaxID=1465 RepID=UPI003D196D63